MFELRLRKTLIALISHLQWQIFGEKWHITLSKWVRDYVIFPWVVQNRQAMENLSQHRYYHDCYRNIAWCFLEYGIYGTFHGTAVAINRWQRKRTNRMRGLLLIIGGHGLEISNHFSLHRYCSNPIWDQQSCRCLDYLKDSLISNGFCLDSTRQQPLPFYYLAMLGTSLQRTGLTNTVSRCS